MRHLGIVEGFYGRTWSGADRLAWVDTLARLGLNSYLYAPKADPWLRRLWPEDWPRREWLALRDLAAACAQRGVQFGVGLSPFALYQDYSATRRRQLLDKIRRINELRAPLLAILFDDMPGDCAGLAERQAEIVADVRAVSCAQQLFVCPTYYSLDPVLERHFGRRPAGYWEQLGALMPVEVGLFWTGPEVCSPRLSCEDQHQAAELLGRPVVLWDNYPVNDGARRSRHLYLESLPDRAVAASTITRGHFCNPMNQAWLSMPGVAGLATLYRTLGGQSDLRVERELESLLGSGLLASLREDSGRFVQQGLDGFSPAARELLLRRYAAQPGPAAAELCAWLREEYRFDPACLTD